MIFVSAGHYPSAPGAKWERFIEHDEAVVWASRLVQLMDNSLLVPTGILQTKVEFINSRAMNGDVAIEIHFNAARDSNNNPIGKGCETLYFPGSDKGKALADVCQGALSEFFPPNRGSKEGWYKMNKEKGPDFFLARTKCVAVIIEPEFVHRSEIITNNREAAMQKLASALLSLDDAT